MDADYDVPSTLHCLANLIGLRRATDEYPLGQACNQWSMLCRLLPKPIVPMNDMSV